jgi:hypothetical protein
LPLRLPLPLLFGVAVVEVAVEVAVEGASVAVAVKAANVAVAVEAATAKAVDPMAKKTAVANRSAFFSASSDG